VAIRARDGGEFAIALERWDPARPSFRVDEIGHLELQIGQILDRAGQELWKEHHQPRYVTTAIALS